MFKISAKYQEKRNRLTAIRMVSRKLNNAEAIVGWEGDERYPGTDITVAQVAVFNEYGTAGRNGKGAVPARPFMRQAYYHNLPALVQNRNEAYQGVISGKMTVERALRTMGYRFQEMVRREILRGDFQKNASRTLSAKKRQGQGGRPLIATKRMLNAIRTRVVFNAEDLTKNKAQQAARADARNLAAAAAQDRQGIRIKTAGERRRLQRQMRKEVREAKEQKRNAERREVKRYKANEKRENLAAKLKERKRAALDRRNEKRERDKRRDDVRAAVQSQRHQERRAVKRYKTQEKKKALAAKKVERQREALNRRNEIRRRNERRRQAADAFNPQTKEQIKATKQRAAQKRAVKSYKAQEQKKAVKVKRLKQQRDTINRRNDVRSRNARRKQAIAAFKRLKPTRK